MAVATLAFVIFGAEKPPTSEALKSTTISADRVYTVINSHYSGTIEGDLTYKMARDAYNLQGPVPLSERRHVLLISRDRKKARGLSNEPLLVNALRRQVGLAADADARRLKVLPFKLGGAIAKDIEAVRYAALIVAPHGAGLSNMICASERTAVIEICFDGNNASLVGQMACPPMYGLMGVNLGLPYWVVTGRGLYGSEMAADLPQVEAAAAAALAKVYDRRRSTESFTSVAECRRRR